MPSWCHSLADLGQGSLAQVANACSAKYKYLNPEDYHIILFPSLVPVGTVKLQAALVAIMDLDNKNAIEGAMGYVRPGNRLADEYYLHLSW